MAKQAGTTSENNQHSLSIPLRLQLNRLLQAPSAVSSSIDKAGSDSRELRRQAALFALDNFCSLQDAEKNCITEDRLFDLLRSNTLAHSGRPLISILYRDLKSIGHVIGERESTIHVSANGAAMPVTFRRPDIAIDAFDLFNLIATTGRASKV